MQHLTRAHVLTLACALVPGAMNAQASAATPAATPSATPTTPGIYELVEPGSGRRYTLSIPEGYTGQQPAPFVMALHYGYEGAPTAYYGHQYLNKLVLPALAELGAIIVAPDNVTRGWANPEGERHVTELFDYIAAHYNIDKSKTLLTGYSMGGMGTWYLAPRHADLFRAAVAISGRPQADSPTFEWKTPMYVIHSTADRVVPIAPTKAAVEAIRAKGGPLELVVIDSITHGETARFAPYLKQAVPWIRRAWSRSSPGTGGGAAQQQQPQQQQRPLGPSSTVMVVTENPALRLLDKANGTAVTDINFWRVSWSPVGPGSVCFITVRNTPGMNMRVAITDTVAITWKDLGAPSYVAGFRPPGTSDIVQTFVMVIARGAAVTVNGKTAPGTYFPSGGGFGPGAFLALNETWHREVAK